MPFFACASLIPFGLLALGAGLGGIWPWIALIYMTGFTAILDRIIGTAATPDDDREFPVADALSVCLVIAQCAVMGAVIATLSNAWMGLSGAPMAWPTKAALFTATALVLGQIGNSNAHELIHRPARILRRLGVFAYITVLYGHHTSSHVLVHHIRVATDHDPATARKGESFYRFVPRAWWGSFIHGWQAETRRLHIAKRRAIAHPYVIYLTGAVAMVGAVWSFGGGRGVAWYLGLALAAQLQLLLSDYVQHYGLIRKTDDAGRTEPFGMAHAWNAPHPVSGWMMLNAPRHSDHHRNPARAYPALRLPQAVPMLPHALPVMAVIALFPPLWRKVMHPRLNAWQRTRG